MSKNTELIKVKVDSREQLPYTFKNMEIETFRGCLKTGDYSLLNYPCEIIIERKTLPDLFGIVGNHRDRFKRELQRMRDTCDFPVLLIEGTVLDIMEKNLPYGSLIHPNAVIGSLISWSVKFNVRVIFAGSRKQGEMITAQYLTKMHEVLAESLQG